MTSDIVEDAELLRVQLRKGQLKQNSDIIVDQVRAIDNRRLLNRIGALTPTQIQTLQHNLRIVLNLWWRAHRQQSPFQETLLKHKNLYPKLSAGGYVIIDDYNAFQNCRQAVSDYRKENSVTEPIMEIDKEAIYWRKQQWN